MKGNNKSSHSAKQTRRRKPMQVRWEEQLPFEVPVPRDEPERLAELHDFEILDTGSEEVFDSITLLASHICGTPIALITLIDSDRQWFKSKVGITLSETSRDIAFCAHTIMTEELFILPDASKDKRFAQHPLVRSHPRIRFYAGAPLVTRNHHALGTLCVIDRVPRKLSREQEQALRALSRQVMAQLESRRQIKEMQRRLQQQRNEYASLTRQLGQSNARKRSSEEALRRIRHELRANSKSMITLVDQALGGWPASPSKRALRSVRSMAQALLERAPE
jgi:GAF domain-containing protein